MGRMKKYLIGFDVGTSESKGTICDEQGNVLDTQTMAHELIIPRSGHIEHDPLGYWWNELKTIVPRLLKNANASPTEVAAIGCSAIACAATPIDESGTPLRNAILYGIDTRSDAEIKELTEKIGEQRILEHCGQALSAESFGPKVLWVKNNEPEIFKRAKQFTFTQSFLNRKLTGNNIADVYSVKFAEPFFDMKTKDWDDEMCGYVLDKSMLPKVMWATDVIGNVTKEAAEETGLMEGTPVICGTTDAAAEAVSVGVIEPGDLMLMYGSTLFITQLYQKEIEKESDLWKSQFIFKDTLCAMSAMATTGSLVQWFKKNFAKDIILNEKQTGDNAFTTMFEGIKDIEPGANALFVLPYFAGERMPIKDDKAKGMIFGLTLEHNRNDVFRAVIEGIGHGLKQNINLFRDAGFKAIDAIAVGGGTKSKIWMQIMSDMTGCKQTVKQVSVGASYGDALLAGLGVGIFKSRKQLKELTRTKYCVEPDSRQTQKYEKLHEIYKDLYINNKEIMHKV